jgi:hypothetical protein
LPNSIFSWQESKFRDCEPLIVATLSLHRTNPPAKTKAMKNLFARLGLALTVALARLIASSTSAEAQNLFEGDFPSGRIHEFTNGVAAEGGIFASLPAPVALAFDGAGDLFVATVNGYIYEFTPGGVQSTFASGLSNPAGLAFNSGGDLFEADYASGNIYEFTPSGVKSTFATGLSLPSGLAFNSAGDLFVADFSAGNIYEFAPSGVQSTFATGLQGPRGLAFQPQASIFSGLTASQSINYGAPAITLAGTVSTMGPGYPFSGEAITVTINGNAQTTTINDATGDFSFSYNPATLPASETPYTIAYSYAGDLHLYPTTNSCTMLTVNPLAVVLTGARRYDGTATAVHGILSVANSINSDVVNVASGSAILAGAGVGPETITSFAGLTLGGLNASNYTLTAASGEVMISNPFSPFSITTSSLDITGTNFVVCWQSVPGVVYSVLTNTSLAGPAPWLPAGNPITATNTITCFTLPGGFAGQSNVFVVIKQ